MSSSFEEVSRELLSRYAHCLDRDGSEAFDTLASVYQYHLLYSVITQMVPAGAKVLDWGCGSGHFSWFLHRQGYQAHSFGFAEPALVANEIGLGEIEYVHGDPSEPVALPFDDGVFDAVVSVGVLEHVREYGGSEVGSLAEIRRILKPNGIFVCYHFPNKGSWIEFLARLTGKWSHRYLYGRNDVLRTFRQGRLNIVSCCRYGFLPRNSLRHLPITSLRSSVRFARLINTLDAGLSLLASPICQNWLVVAQKTDSCNA